MTEVNAQSAAVGESGIPAGSTWQDECPSMTVPPLLIMVMKPPHSSPHHDPGMGCGLNRMGRGLKSKGAEP